MTSEAQAGAIEEAGIGKQRDFLHLLLLSMRAHAVFFALVFLYFISIFFVDFYVDGLKEQDFGTLSLSFFLFTVPVLFIALVTLRFLHVAFVLRSRRPAIALVRDVREVLFHPQRAANALPIIAALFFFMKVFSYYKTNIPVIVPFHWDAAFTRLDRVLHFGKLPWEWLQPVLGHPLVTFLLNINYNLWFMVMWVVWVGFAFRTEPSELRTRFFLSFILVWSVGGSFLAILFSSAGPCYAARVGLSPDPYAGLMHYLYGVHAHFPLWAIRTQELLWSAYEGKQNVVAGITAMPSMHNASTLLFALAGWKTDRRIGIALSIFAFFIFIGSIHLGWHYAVDTYAGYAITLVIWGVCGPLARWHERQPWAVRHRAFVRNAA